jgi:hypothetical protein
MVRRGVNPVEDRKESVDQNTHPVDQHHLNVQDRVKVKNGVKHK